MKNKAINHATKYIKSYLKFKYDYSNVPGFVASVSYDGKIILNEAFGHADVENKIKMTNDHIFRVASHSKTFTATAIMQLQEQGKLRIDDYITDYLDWLKEHDDTRWQKVTIRQIMSHSAGITRDGKDVNFWGVEEPFPDEKQLQEEILKTKLVFDNNTKFKYSNFGYSLLGLLIYKVSGLPYNEYVTKNIIQPLKLKNTYPEQTYIKTDNLVTGYSRLGINRKRLPIAKDISTNAMSSATGFCSTASDLCAYFDSHMIGRKSVLSEESKKEMQRIQWQTSMNSSYGLGLEISYCKNNKLVGHGGGFPGHATKSFFDSEHKIVISVLANSINGNANNLANSVYDTIIYFLENYKTSSKKLDKYEGRYVSLWGATDFVSLGDKIMFVCPFDWSPFNFVGSLKHVHQHQFQIVNKNSSFGSNGETALFDIKDNKVTSINYAGEKLLPESVYNENLENTKIIGLIKK